MHASQWNNDNSHCTAYLLRHLRKILLLAGMTNNNREAIRSSIHLSSIPPAELTRSHSRSAPDANELRRQHNDEHGSVGLPVRLSLEDLDKLDFVLQPPKGGEMSAQSLKVGEFLWKCLYTDPPPPMASIALGDVEREIRQHLEMELLMNNLKEEENTGTGSKRSISEGSECKETSYTRLHGTTVMLKPNVLSPDETISVNSTEPPNYSSNGGRLPDLVVSDCSDAHFYLLRPYEFATIARCSNCTIVVGAVAGLIHIADCDKISISIAGRRVLISNSVDVIINMFSPSPPLLVGDNRTCQFAPYNTHYDGIREDLLATGLAAAVLSSEPAETPPNWPPLQCASNKWKQPVEVSKLEVPHGPNTGSPTAPPLSPGADDRAMGTSGSDSTLQAPILQPAAEYRVLFVPLDRPKEENMYCRLLGEVLQLSPFRMPVEYEKSALAKPDRMKYIQSTVQKKLNPDQQKRFEDQLNRGFRDWLVTSGNLRQVLDLVHLEEKTNE